MRTRFNATIKDVVSLDLKNDINGTQDLKAIIKLRLKQLDGIGDPLPPSWVKIREALLSEGKHFISFERFRVICKKYDVTDVSMIRTLSGYFDRIGAITHYIDDPILSERVYLDSNWLVKTVYEVLDSVIAKNKQGRLTESDIKKMWDNNELHYEVHKLTQIMHKFGLMYKVSDEDKYIIPAHLPASQPYSEWKHANNYDLLRFTYEFDKFMPHGIMSHLIVQLNYYIEDHDLVWHKGVNVKIKGASAEIRETLGGKNSFEIRIAGINKRELLAVIRERFREVLTPYKKLNFLQLVPCICTVCRKLSEPTLYDYSRLMERISNQKQTVECEKHPYNKVSISELLDNIQMPENRVYEGADLYDSSTSNFSKKKIFISYSHNDEYEWKDEFCKHLSSLKDDKIIEHWHDRQIESGYWDMQIEQAMENADVFILLVTHNFIASDYISTKEIAVAYRKFKKGNAIIIPIICDACKWEIKPLGDNTKLGQLLAYPRNGKPIKNWINPNDGFLDAINQLERLLKS